MATVYIWFGGKEEYGIDLDGVGHVSLKYGSNENDYISFWPTLEVDTSSILGDRKKRGFETRDADPIENYAKDYKEIGRHADLIIEINFINKALVQAYWKTFLSGKNAYFNIRNQNCSTVISKALIVGSKLDKKLKDYETKWFDHLYLAIYPNTALVVIDHLFGQILRLVGVRSAHEIAAHLDKMINDHLRLPFARSATIRMFVKKHEEIFWTPYYVAVFTSLLKKELNNSFHD